MELLLLNEKFELLSHPIDRYYSLIWRERYYDEGDFELHLAADYLETVLRSEYLYNNERDEAMVIEGVEAQDDGKRTIKITGRSLESLFRDRVMDAEGSSSGKVEEISRSAVQTYAMTGSRAIPLLKLGALGGFTETAAASNKRGAELYEWQRELLRPYEMSFKLHYDYEANSLDYTVYRGLDRTQEQTANTWAIFSTSYENLAQFAYSRSKTDYRNFAIVISSDGTKRVEVDKTGGAKRRELYVDTDDGLDTAAMTQLGEQALTEYAMVETVSGEVQNGANMVYGVDFDLGDLCHIEDAHLGISATARLTEMTTVVENGVTRRIPAFGEQYLNLRQYVAREVGASGTSAGSSSGGGGVVDLTGIEQAIAANVAAIEAANEEIEAVQAAAYDNAAAIQALTERVAVLEEGGSVVEGLPDGYVKLLYISFTGTQYIDTGVAVSAATIPTLRFVADMELTNSTSVAAVDGTGNVYPYVFMGTHQNNLVFYGTGNAAITSSVTYVKDRYIWDYDCTKGALIVGDLCSITGITFDLSGSAARNWYIGGYSTGATPVLHTEDVYGYQIYSDGNLIRDYVPCVNPEGEYGLYDMVTKTFYGNNGSGTITGYGNDLPKGYTELAYIRTDGMSWIDTGVQPTSKTRVIADVKGINVNSKGSSIFGARRSNSLTAYIAFFMGTYIDYAYGSATQKSDFSMKNERVTVDTNANVMTVTGSSTVSAAATASTFSVPYNLYLGTNNTDGQAEGAPWSWDGRIYSCKIYDNGTLLRAFIPCKNENDVYGFYDKVNRSFYANIGTGSFTGG